jgi:hypothetical protein
MLAHGQNSIRRDNLEQKSTTFSLPLAVLAIHILVEVAEKLMPWTESGTVFL